MDVVGVARTISLFFTNSQSDLAIRTKRLSSGLRINSASDDPSGLAVSQALRANASGFEQGQRNVEEARQALTVAEGALDTITKLVSRIRDLAVEANNDVTSAADQKNLQDEIDQILHEIDSIASKTEFNGKKLLDGSIATPKFQNPNATITTLAAPTGASGLPSSQNVVDETGGGSGPGPLVTSLTVAPNTPSSYFKISVDSYDKTTDTYTVTTTNYGPQWGNGIALVTSTQIPAGFGQIPAQVTDYYNNANTSVQFNLANLTTGGVDVGVAQQFQIVAGVVTNALSPSTPINNSQPLQINSGPDEGKIVTIAIDAVNSAALGLSNISVVPPQQSDNPLDPIVTATSAQITATYAEYQADSALQIVVGQRAQIGAQIVSLGVDEQNAAVAQVNIEASESQIADASIATETTQFTKDQILTSFQFRLLQNAYSTSQQILDLVRFSAIA